MSMTERTFSNKNKQSVGTVVALASSTLQFEGSSTFWNI